MTEDNNLQYNVPQQEPQPGKSLKSKPLLIMVVTFAVFWVIVFMTQNKESISWVKDYEEAVKLAGEQNKPLLLLFYKPNAKYYVAASNDTYKNPEAKKFVESVFVPVLINVEERKDLAKVYNINYYPTIYVKEPDSEEKFGPRLGYDPPGLFIREMTNLLDELKKSKQ